MPELDDHTEHVHVAPARLKPEAITFTMSTSFAMDAALSARHSVDLFYFPPEMIAKALGLPEDEAAELSREEAERRAKRDRVRALSDHDYLVQEKGFDADEVTAFLTQRAERRAQFEADRAERQRVHNLWRNRLRRAATEVWCRLAGAWDVLVHGTWDCDCDHDDD
ncbi:hypothetical protein SEA_CAFASSO_112 [Gordonia phage Cafasso]|uniref:Uncharacterized protein n=1 Tax=Gordonia phage Cafasso TaxID=2851095 RepID=A0AAE7SF16_9CAUD|nr:hypothetical protein SEA_CAFASSO_112 [Gordonia phage Cafasso]